MLRQWTIEAETVAYVQELTKTRIIKPGKEMQSDLIEVFIKGTVKAELRLHFLCCIIEERRHLLMGTKREEGSKDAKEMLPYTACG